ncbi:MAG: hypothetical protein RL380_1716 [Verrucomicrobiota bacterium]|jgi:protein translocase SecG subunit
MTFIIGLLTAALVLNCLLLILLVLIQLPKKDAGAGLAFGGGASDALFGAGAGNALTNITKWATVCFFGLALLIGVLKSKEVAHRSDLTVVMENRPAAPAPPAAAAATLADTNTLLSFPAATTNAPAK